MSDILARLKADPLAALREVLLAAPSTEIGHDDYDLHPELRPATQERAVEAAVLHAHHRAARTHHPVHPAHGHLGAPQRTSEFPGGRRDASDLSPLETALRETQEETGIEPAFISVAGYLRAIAPAPVLTSRRLWAC